MCYHGYVDGCHGYVDVLWTVVTVFCFVYLQVKRLEAQIHQLTENQVKGDERTTRMKEENSMLVERYVHIYIYR